MTTVQKNILANYAGSAWNVITSLAFVPLYIKFIGIEAYGLIGFFSSIQIVLSLLDLGLGSAFNREIARLSALHDTQQTIRNLVKTFSSIYWAIGAAVAILFVAIEPLITGHWIKSNTIPHQTIRLVIILMGLGIAVRWPSNVYSGALAGLQKLVISNVLYISYITLRSVGAVLVLWLISPTITAFFWWQLIVTILGTLSYLIITRIYLPNSENPPRFDSVLLKQLWKFAAGMAGINICATILYQLDKILLSKLIPLQQFGYYALAANIAYSIIAIIFPITGAIFPRFSQLYSTKNELALSTLYHQTCQFVSIAILPLGVIICLFSYEILIVWIHNKEIAQNTKMILSLLTVGIMLNALMAVPYYLQVATGWTKLLLYFNIGAVVAFAPLIIFLVHVYGTIGGAMAWIVINVFYVVIVIQIMHSRILIGGKMKWYFDDVGRPLLAAIGLGGIGRLIMPSLHSPIAIASIVFGIYVIALSGGILSTPLFWTRWKKFLFKPRMAL